MTSRTCRLLAATVVAASALALLPVTRAMDRARIETRVDAAVAKYGVTGRGVLVAILDRGINYTNNDFRNADGTTRIARIFDLSDDRGASDPANAYDVGTIYTREQIDAALASGTPLPTRDAIGHGDATAGIATGNGANSANALYRGIAPEATLIVVKIVGGAPAHGDQPAEPGFYDPERVLVGIRFVRDTARSMGMPCVMLLNIGSQGGPTDGTSELARLIDETVRPGTPGLVFVTGPGDDGGVANRCGGVVASGATTSIQIQKGAAGTMVFDLWYPGTDRFDVRLITPSGTFGPYAAPEADDGSAFVRNAVFDYYNLGPDVDFFNADNSKREISLYIGGPIGTYTIELIGRQVTSGRFDGTLNPASIFQSENARNRILTFVAPGSIWDGATARYNVCPGDYVLRQEWVDLDGITRGSFDEGDVGELWTGTSIGPTFDGRIGVDVCAPGNTVFTTYSPTSYYSAFRFNQIQGGGGFYGAQSAVSAAAPQVTGIVALMLELDPNLDALAVKSILQETGRRDAFTGNTPNTSWGHGKVDALAALDEVDGLRRPEVRSVKLNVFKGKLTINGTGFEAGTEVFLDTVGFETPAKVKASGQKLVQSGRLVDGRTLGQAIAIGATVRVIVRAPDGGTTVRNFTRS